MRIASSQVNMQSNRFYSQMGVKSKNSSLGNKSFMGVASKAYGNVADSSSVNSVGLNNNSLMGNNNFSYNVLSSMLQRLMGNGVFSSGGGGYMQQFLTYQESESTSFSAKGTAVTEDGREINFGVNVSMSRQFMQYMNIEMPAMQNALMDPLVINIGTDSAKVSDQKFKFDLDSDGTMDNIAMPTKGSAFLAFDKNEDGIINDGSELLGTETGDGFRDLSRYDSDGNGWIDENDEIFSKLKVWYKDENGNDVMMNLKEADVGAIYLGEQDTEFTLAGKGGNTSGVIRSSGIFLRESGEVGTIQHVDLAKLSDSELKAEEAEELAENAGALTLNLGNNTSANNRAERARQRKADAEALRAKKAAQKKIMNEQIEKRRMERKEMQEQYYERNMERHRMYMEAIGL